MATRTNVNDNTDLDAATGTALASTDTLILDNWDTDFTVNTSKPLVNLQAITVKSGFTGKFDSQPFNVQCNQTGSEVNLRTGGDVFRLRSNSGAGTLKKILWNSVKASAILDLAEAIVPDLTGLNGSVIMADSVTPTNIRALKNCHMYLRGAANAASTIETQGGALLETEKGFTSAVVGGRSKLRISGRACAAGDVDLEGGTLELVDAASLGNVDGMSGVIDARGLKRDLAATGGTLGPDVTILLKRGGAEFDYSACTLVYGGPEVLQQ